MNVKIGYEHSSWSFITRRPPTNTDTALPFNTQFINGEFLDFDSIESFVYVYSLFGSIIAISAMEPFFKVPLFMPSIFEGFTDIFIMRSAQDRIFFSTSSMADRLKHVSNPMIPNGAKSNSTSFSLSV